MTSGTCCRRACPTSLCTPVSALPPQSCWLRCWHAKSQMHGMRFWHGRRFALSPRRHVTCAGHLLPASCAGFFYFSTSFFAFAFVLNIIWLYMPPVRHAARTSKHDHLADGPLYMPPAPCHAEAAAKSARAAAGGLSACA